MKLRLPISLSLLLLAAQAACAQNAEEFFNGGAQFYISNNIPAALQKVESGRILYPKDEQLKKLEELLKQQQQSQQNQQQKQQNQSQQQSKNKQQSQQKQQEQQSKSQQEQAKKKQSEENKQQASKPSEEQQKQQPNEKQEQASAAHAAGQMTPEEAKQLLNAQKGDEKLLPARPKTPPANNNRVIKDW